MANEQGPVERYNITLDELLKMERDILIRRHVERYAMVRQHIYGSVLDFACGVGYGSYLISKNPDVQEVIGVDKDQDAINHATLHFKTNKTRFLVSDIENYSGTHNCFVCLETIEHIKNSSLVPALAIRCGVELTILSYPSKKTTHYNPFHYHDFRLQDIKDLFSEFLVTDVRDLHGEVTMVFLLGKHNRSLKDIRK